MSRETVRGGAKLRAHLQDMINTQKRGRKVKVQVGYSAPYAMKVHELVEMKLKGQPRTGRMAFKTKSGKTWQRRHKGRFWDPQGKGQAKFLESAIRDPIVQQEMQAVILNALSKDLGAWERALLRAGNILKKASQERVPVEFGALKRSAFVKVG